eukprot:5406298-Pyramimonas_sp.AAC.1
MAKKITLDFERPIEATDFLNNFARDGSFDFPDPLVPQSMLHLPVKRDQDIKARKRFLSMGR